jgi:hypothetical protein
MAIIYSYPTVNPERTDLILGTDVSVAGKPTKNFTVQSIIDLVTVATGDLQTVLDLGNVATNRDIDLTNNAFRGGSFVTTGSATISGTTGTGFTNVTSTEFTGTIATAAQPNITSLGDLTSLVVNGPISGTSLIVNSALSGAQNDNVVSALAIKTYVDNKVGLYDTLQEVLANGNTTGGTDIAVSAGDDITFTDTSKILMGTTAVDNLEIYNDSANSFIIDKSPGALKLQTSLLSVRDEADTTQTISASTAGAVELYHAGDKKIETLAGGAKVTGAFQATTSGTFASLVNTGTYTDSSGDIGTAGQILSSTGSGTNWVTELPLYTWSYEGTNIPSGTAMTVTDGTNITTTWDATNFDLTIATTGVPDGSGAANQVTYWSDTDTLTGAAGFTFAGGATGKVAIAGELEVGGVLTDGTFTGSAGTYTGYVSITSTDFVGALTGNADTATALASSGAIALTGDTTSTGGPYTYTSGGAISIATTIANTTVTAKLLTNLPTPTSAAISAGDTILAAMAKLQGQIDGIAGSLAFEGTWDASTGNPPSATPLNGQFWIVSVAGNTDLDGITDWQVGDWAIYVDNGAGTDAWQKLDQSNEVLGSGAANKIAKWTSTNTLATGLIEDDGTDVTVGNSGNLIVEGNTTLGDADTDTTTVKGPGVFEETAQFNVGIGLSSTPDYGTAGQVLTSGGGSATANTWTTPTTGTVTSVGLTETGDALTITGSPVTSSGTINIAGAGTASQYINGELNLVTFPTVDNYQYWTLAGDSGTPQNITSTNTATIAGGLGINTLIPGASTDTINVNIDYIGADNAILSAPAGTPVATDELWFNNADVSNGSIQRATISDIVNLGNETLSQVLSNGNTTGGTDIAVSAADDITFATDSKAIFGASNQLQIYYNDTTESNIYSSGLLYLQSDDLRFNSTAAETMATFTANGAVELFYDAQKKFETTTNGVTVLGQGLLMEGTSSPQEAVLTMGTANNTPTIKMMNIGSNYIYSPNGNVVIRSGGTPVDGLRVSGSTVFLSQYGQGNLLPSDPSSPPYTGYPTYDLAVSNIGKILEVEQAFPYQKSGIFNGDKAIIAAATREAFVLNRATTGALVFDVFFTSETSTGTSVCKKYTVAHANNATPVYNKIIDTGPVGSNDFTVTFLNAGSGLSVQCNIQAVGVSQNIGYTVQVGYDSVNNLTFTPS